MVWRRLFVITWQNGFSSAAVALPIAFALLRKMHYLAGRLRQSRIVQTDAGPLAGATNSTFELSLDHFLAMGCWIFMWQPLLRTNKDERNRSAILPVRVGNTLW
jgi:hypothetical protein